MEKYNYSKPYGLIAGISKVAIAILILDLTFIVATILITGKCMDAFALLIVSQIVGVLGSVFIGFPVAIAMNIFGSNNNLIAALICGIIVFLVIFFLWGGEGFPKRNIKMVLFFVSYGLACGYWFNRGYKKPEVCESY